MNKTFIKIMAFLLSVMPVELYAGDRTLKEQMSIIHERFNVNFIYGSTLDVNVPYTGPELPLPESLASGPEPLERVLDMLFEGTGISYEVTRHYVVLKKGKKRPRNYIVFADEEKRDTIAEARILATLDIRRNSTQTGLQKIDSHVLDKGFAVLSSPDVIKTLQTLPGVASGAEMISGLYVHGGTGRDNLFLLDGVPMYNVSHLAGLFSSFNHEIVESVDFYKSGFPVRYGGRLSSVVDVTSRPGNMQEYKGTFSIGLINGSIQFEGPIVKDRTSFNLSLRHSWLDVLTAVAVPIMNSSRTDHGKYGGRYAMYDINASVTHLFRKDNQLSFNFYTGRDVLKYEDKAPDVGYWEGVRYVAEEGMALKASWGNILASLNWQDRISEKLNIGAVAYYTSGFSGLDMETAEWQFNETPSYAGARAIYYDSAEKSASRLHNVSANVSIDYIPLKSHHVRGGLSYVWHRTNPSCVVSRRTYSEDGDYKMSSSETAMDNAHEISVYAEDEMALTPWMKVNAGLRYSIFTAGRKVWHSVEPRAAVRFQCGGITSLKLSYSRMSQPMHYVSSHFLDLPLGAWYPSSADVRPMDSHNISMGVYLDLPKGFGLDVEGYWKSMENIMEYYGTSYFFPPLNAWESDIRTGRGRSYGMDVQLGYTRDRLELSAAYTLSWTERYFPEIFHDWFYDRYDNRHKLTLTGTYRFNDRVRVYASWNYHSGNRVTVPTSWIPPAGSGTGKLIYDVPANYRLADYHRLDIGADFTRRTRKGYESIWNVSVYNAYCRMNPLYVYTEISNDNMSVRAKAMAMFPILPSFSYTLKF